jgi:alpha-maltose-1-phosphate synthase
MQLSGTSNAVAPDEAKLASTAFTAKGRGAQSGAGAKTPKVLLSRTTAAQFSRNALRSLVEHDMLAEFWTTVVWNPKSGLNRLMPQGLQTQLARRSVPEAPAHLVKGFPWREAVRLGVRGTPFEQVLSSGERPFSVVGMGKSFDRHVARRLSKLQPNLVYAYDGAASETFREAKRLGIVTCLEVAGLYWHWERQFFSEQAERDPEFAGLLPQLDDSADQMRRNDDALALADYVFVASRYAMRALQGVVPDEKIRVVNYGAPPVREVERTSRSANDPLKVIFVGSLIQRKGIGYVLKAVNQLGSRVELTLVGSRYRANRHVDEACNRGRWYETMPFADVLRLMRESDVLLLPSLSDAFGMVVTEALANGLPVIVTPNTGASEIISDGREGFVVPIADADAIAERLEVLCRNREMLAEMSRHAQATAAQNSWENYRTNWARALEGLAC